MRKPHPSGRPKRQDKQGVVTRVQGQPQGFVNTRLEGPWLDTRAVGFVDYRRNYLFDDEEDRR